jgi:hypothetical protein
VVVRAHDRRTSRGLVDVSFPQVRDGAKTCSLWPTHTRQKPCPASPGRWTWSTVSMCVEATTAADRDHAMTCASVKGRATLRHDIDILKGILPRAMTGVASALEPTLHRLPGLETGARDVAAGSASAGLQARGDILLALDTSMAVADVSVTHPGGGRAGGRRRYRWGMRPSAGRGRSGGSTDGWSPTATPSSLSR